MIEAHGFKTPLLITGQPVQVELLPAPVIETTWALDLNVKMVKAKMKGKTTL